jgi:uncharacterized membrane protein
MDSNALLKQMQELSERERRVIGSWLKRKPVAQDVNQEFREQLSLGQRLADKVAAFGGSWTFIFLFLAGMMVWMLINEDRTEAFDPFPFILLNLILSCLAALQAPVIMMSQNRQASKDRLEAHYDYEVNMKAEMEIMDLHAKLDKLRDAQWSELIALQQRQVELLEELRGGKPEHA